MSKVHSNDHQRVLHEAVQLAIASYLKYRMAGLNAEVSVKQVKRAISNLVLKSMADALEATGHIDWPIDEPASILRLSQHYDAPQG